jgi:TP901 family phage tail tape measure protein
LEVAAKASIGGVTDLETAVDGLTTILNAFGMESSEVGRVADVMFATVRGGKTTMDELSNSMFQAAPVAAAAGVSLEEMSAAVATITKQGTPTKVAMTGLRGAMLGLLRPSEDMRVLLDELGFSTGRSAIEQLGLVGALDAVRTATRGNDEQLAKAIGSMEGLTPVLQVTGSNLRIFEKDLHDISTAAGASDTAFEEMQKTSARQFALMKANFTELKISVGTTLIPIFNDVANTLGPVIEGIANFAENHGWLVKTIAIGAAVILGLGTSMAVLGVILGPLIGLVTALAASYAAAATTGGVLAGVMAILTGPVGIGLLIAGVGSAVVAMAVLTDKMGDAGKSIEEAGDAAGELGEDFENLGEDATSAAKVVGDAMGGMETDIAAVGDIAVSSAAAVVDSTGAVTSALADQSTAFSENAVVSNQLRTAFKEQLTTSDRLFKAYRENTIVLGSFSTGMGRTRSMILDGAHALRDQITALDLWSLALNGALPILANVEEAVEKTRFLFQKFTGQITTAPIHAFGLEVEKIPHFFARWRGQLESLPIVAFFETFRDVALSAGDAASLAVDRVTKRLEQASLFGAMMGTNFETSFGGITEVVTRAVDPMKFFLKNIRSGFDETAQSAEDLKQAILGLSNLSAGEAGKVINAAFDEALRQAGKGNLIGATFADTVLAGGGANIVAGASPFDLQNLPKAASGGMIPGRTGQPFPMIGHGGELVVPANQVDRVGGAVGRAAVGGDTFVFYGDITGFDNFEERVAEAWANRRGRGGFAGASI